MPVPHGSWDRSPRRQRPGARRQEGGLTSVPLHRGLGWTNASHAKRTKARRNETSYDLALFLFARPRARPQTPKQGGAYEASHDCFSPSTRQVTVELAGKSSVAPESFLFRGLACTPRSEWVCMKITQV